MTQSVEFNGSINLREMSLAQLIAEYDRLQHAINENDGRLSTGSSAQLDLEMEQQDDIAAELRKRLGIARFVKPLIQEEMRQYRVNRKRNIFIRILLRIGFVSVQHDGELHWPFHIPPSHNWRHLFRVYDSFYVFRNLPGVIKWNKNRWLPVRWGFGIFGFEFGDRGSAMPNQDPVRESLFKRSKPKRLNTALSQQIRRALPKADDGREEC